MKSQIQSGDITSWAKATASFQYPKGTTKRRKGAKFAPVNTDALRPTSPVLTVVNPNDVVIDAENRPGKGGIAKGIKEADKTVRIVEARLSATDFINAKLANLTSNVRHVAGNTNHNEGDDLLVWTR